MGLQSSGAISLDDLHVEVGGTSGTTCSLNDPDIRALIDVGDGAGQSIQQYYGQSAETSLPTGGSTVNGQVQLKQISASSYISSGGTLRIPSNMWVWTDSTSTAALTIDIACTVINDGKVIGQGGVGGQYPAAGRTAGGPAINVTASGVTIINSSGAYIAGGGGGGANSQQGGDPQDQNAGGGGGAGGGNGGRGHSSIGGAGVGGTLNASGGGSYHLQTGSLLIANGGGAGGGGGGAYWSNRGGGGGGRILPGTGGDAGQVGGYGNGGSGGNAGGTYRGPGYGSQSAVAGGGGGWGASGGNGAGPSGGYGTGAAGGAAITGTSRTLSNSGTIYGST